MQDFFAKNQEIKLECAFYVVATPIGNLSDISLRALQIIANANLILCEDSRVSSKLLKAYKIEEKKLLVYNDHGGEKIRERVLNHLLSKESVVLISDAGTPLISDPGYKLVNFLRQNNQKIIPIPGASAINAAICASGIACDNFLFLGFLPNSKIQKEKYLKSLPKEFTLVFFESPHRVLESLISIHESLGNRKVCIARELTKLYEEIVSDEVLNLIEFFKNNQGKLRGEFVIIVEKIDKNEKSFDENDLKKDIILAIKSGASIKDLSQDLSQIYQIHKKEVYKLALEISAKDK